MPTVATTEDDPYAQVPFYTPRTMAHPHWAPEQVPLKYLRLLARASQRVHLSPLARRYFLANALVENLFYVNFGLSFPFYFGPQLDKLPASCFADPSLPAPFDHRNYLDPNYSTPTMASACAYGVVFDYKTGAYATRVFGAGASVERRLSTWNGRGRSHLNGALFGDATNHGHKVMEMYDALSNPKNAKLMKAWKDAGGVTG